MRTSTPEKNSSVVAHPKWESKINKGPPLLAGAKMGMPLNYTGQPWSQITYAASPRTTPPLWIGGGMLEIDFYGNPLKSCQWSHN